MSLCWSDVHEDEATVGEAELRERIERSRIAENKSIYDSKSSTQNLIGLCRKVCKNSAARGTRTHVLSYLCVKEISISLVYYANKLFLKIESLVRPDLNAAPWIAHLRLFRFLLGTRRRCIPQKD